MSSAKCQTCGVEIQPTTAERTGGLCMPCAIDADPKLAGQIRSKRDEAAIGKKSWGQQIKDLGLVVIAGGAVLIILFIAQAAIAVVAGLVAKFVFRTTWSGAWMIGLVTYAVLGFIGTIWSSFDFDNRSFHFKRKPPKK